MRLGALAVVMMMMIVPPNVEKIERKARSGKRKESTLSATSASITQRIQRGTNLPSGKSKKTR